MLLLRLAVCSPRLLRLLIVPALLLLIVGIHPAALFWRCVCVRVCVCVCVNQSG